MFRRKLSFRGTRLTRTGFWGMVLISTLTMGAGMPLASALTIEAGANPYAYAAQTTGVGFTAYQSAPRSGVSCGTIILKNMTAFAITGEITVQGGSTDGANVKPDVDAQVGTATILDNELMPVASLGPVCAGSGPVYPYAGITATFQGQIVSTLGAVFNFACHATWTSAGAVGTATTSCGSGTGQPLDLGWDVQ